MLGHTLSTSAPPTRPASDGTANRRQLWVCGSGPSRERCIQSMARRKQTTARPEKIPMKTERIRKNTSSLKTPSIVENKRREGVTRVTEVDDEEVEGSTPGTRLLIDWQPRASWRLVTAP